jgi:predicted RNase H-like nuclease (RuvC/YqgF family)
MDKGWLVKKGEGGGGFAMNRKGKMSEAEYNPTIHFLTNEVQDLRTRLEECERERDGYIEANDMLQKEIKRLDAEVADLLKTLERVRKWADTRQADQVKKLREIVGEKEG